MKNVKNVLLRKEKHTHPPNTDSHFYVQPHMFLNKQHVYARR